MQPTITKSLANFYLAGISYEKTNTTIRSLFAFDQAAYESLAKQINKDSIPECYILSTCNRTEIYGFASSSEELIHCLCGETKGDAGVFKANAYVKKGEAAVKHLYQVACGLDSQILGDFEIISQVKQTSRTAKALGLLGTFSERLINSVLQVSKQIKNETGLSSGTVSVSFAVVQYLQQLNDIKNKNILLLGTGKIGRNTCKNLVNYLGTKNITLINRTEETAQHFATEQGLSHAPIEALATHLKEADIVLVATNAPTPTLHKKDISTRNKIILDLSIPQNVNADVKNIPGIRVIDVDELSQIQDHTLEARKNAIPKAAAIIEEQMQDFLYWYQMRKHAVILKGMKDRMEKIHRKEIKNQNKETQANIEDLEALSSKVVQKMVNVFASKLRKANGEADNYCQVLGEIFEIPVKE